MERDPDHSRTTVGGADLRRAHPAVLVRPADRIGSDWTAGAAVTFYDGASDTVTDLGEVLESDPPKRLSYRGVQDQLQHPDDVAAWRVGWTPILVGLQVFLEGPDPADARS